MPRPLPTCVNSFRISLFRSSQKVPNLLPTSPRSSSSNACDQVPRQEKYQLEAQLLPAQAHRHTGAHLLPGFRGRRRLSTGNSSLAAAPPRSGPAPPLRAQAASPAPRAAARVAVAVPSSSWQPGTRRNRSFNDTAGPGPTMDRKVAREFRHKVRAAGRPRLLGLRSPGSGG